MAIVDTVGRQSLNGLWTLALDPNNQGREERWFTGGRGMDVREAPVPGTIQQAFPLQHGVAWYWYAFRPTRAPVPSERAHVHFHAVDYLADVWLNSHYLGSHEGGETPFSLDATAALLPGDNLLAVRVLNPTKVPIDGIALAHTPHRNKKLPEDFRPGSPRNYGGIVQSVELLLVPIVRIVDTFVQADVRSGRIDLAITVLNDSGAPAQIRLSVTTGPTHDSVVLAAAGVAVEAPPGESHHETNLQIPGYRLWSLADPYLYRVSVTLETTGRDGTIYRHKHTVRYGFRDFRVVNGYFRLNGTRLFLRSTHTGNHYPIGYYEPADADLLRRDLIYAKAAGFNTVRFIAGMALAEQLDACDEMGLLVYEETLAGWLMQDSTQMGARFDRSVQEMILRDRNHPSVVIWGLLNETHNGPVFQHAATMLPLIRRLDLTRTVLLSSGRWDGDHSIGSVSNPYSSTWEHTWGKEGLGGPPSVMKIGYIDGAGDAHYYPQGPQSDETNTFMRTLGQDSRPIFLSEYGIGSMLDVVHILGRYQQAKGTPAVDDLIVYQGMRDRLEADWQRFGMDDVYPFPRDLLRASQRLHSRQRLLGLNLIRSNPRIAGYNLTGMLDHAHTGEGVWTLWREWKPGVLEALEDGFAPLRWCLFVGQSHAYAGRSVSVEAVLASEDVLQPGDYSARLCIFGPAGRAWEQRTTVRIPEASPGADGPLAVPVLKEEVLLDGPSGTYILAAHLDQGGSPAGDRVSFYLADPAALPTLHGEVTVWGIDARTTTWLAKRGLRCRPFEAYEVAIRDVILVGDLSTMATTGAEWCALLERVARGSVALFLSPLAFRQGEDEMGWLPLAGKGTCHEYRNGIYHREDVAKPHPLFAGLAAPGILDWDYYGPVIPRYVFEGQETPDDVAAVFFATGCERVPAGYASGLLVGSYPLGAGRFLINSLRILENIDQHPVADRLLLNAITYATSLAAGPSAPLPNDFDAHLQSIGYAH